MITDKELQRMAVDTFKRFKVVSAEFAPLGDMKVRWERTHEFIHLYVTDYLIDAPKSVIKAVLERISDALEGKQVEYTKECIDYFLSKEFRERNIELFLKRNGITPSEELSEIAKDYFDDGDDFVGSLDGVTFGTVKHTDFKASILFRVVALNNKVLEGDDVLPELYSGIRYVNTEFPNKPQDRDELRREFFTYYTDGYGV